MTVQIELSDQQAEALQAKAAALGLTLQALFQKLATGEPNPSPSKPLESGYGVLARYGPAPAAEEIDENRSDKFRGFAEVF